MLHTTIKWNCIVTLTCNDANNWDRLVSQAPHSILRGDFMLKTFVVCGVALTTLSATAFAGAITFSGSAASTAGIQATVDAFRSALGANNGAAATPFAGGRREINWDGIPNASAAPNNMSPTQFQGRGVVFSTPGTGFQVSANAGVAPIQFDNLFAGNSTIFEPFSAQRIFSPVGSTITDVTFVAPGSTTAASTSAFGVVFLDVDFVNLTSLSFFDLGNNLLGTFFAPAITGNETFSFLGVQFNAGERVGRVRITAGDVPISLPGCADCVAMDDFIFAEPQAVPEPVGLLLAGAGLAAILLRRRLAA